MALNTGRKMTEQDTEKLNAAAVRFCKKWGIDIDANIDALTLAQDAHEYAICAEDAAQMQKDWGARVKRALGGYTAWGYGYVGHTA